MIMIMKAYSFFKNIFLLLVILAFTACSKDDNNVGVLSSKTMLNREMVASNYSFIWNGVTSPTKKDVKIKFEEIDGDTTKMKMTISDLIPSSDGEIQLVVDVVPKSGEIDYQGKTENSEFTMAVSGSYFPSTSTKGYYLAMTCVYNVIIDKLCDQTFEFDFDNGCTSVNSGNTGSTTIDGTEYTYTELAEKTLAGMTDVWSKTYICAKLTFSKGGELAIDLSSEKNGEVVTTNLMNIKYWLPNHSEMVLEFTEAQAKTFVTTFLNDSYLGFENFFTKYKDCDKYVLRAAYDCDGKLTIKLAAPYNADALTLFVNGKIADAQNNLLQKQAIAFLEVLQESPNAWGFNLVSK